MAKLNRPNYRHNKMDVRTRKIRQERKKEDMFRQNLEQFEKGEVEFVVKVAGFGKTKHGLIRDTVLLNDIRTGDGKRLLCKHLWVIKDDITNPESIPQLNKSFVIKAKVYSYFTYPRGNYVQKWSLTDIKIA